MSSPRATADLAPLVGVFVGGAARRMGGVPKGLLQAPTSGRTLVERLRDEVLRVLPRSRVVLVGEHVAYSKLGWPTLADEPKAIGPLGGLRALLAAGRGAGRACVVALACDLPYLEGELVARVGHHAPEAAAVAPRPDGIWQPLVARYVPERVLPVLDAALGAGERALSRLLERLGPAAVELPLSAGELDLLADWDSAADRRDG
jgi:molybdopterin-guanine dinucleotide biosynthesis protein A